MTTSPSAVLSELRRAGGDTHKRDPRVTPLSIHRSVSLDSDLWSCPNYRCRDCLAKPGCNLYLTGWCLTDGNYRGENGLSQELQYRHQVHNTTQPITTNRTITGNRTVWFSAANFTYCRASDATCRECQSRFNDILDAKSPIDAKHELETMYCIGEDGCVCTGVCEAYEYGTSQARSHIIHPVYSSRRRDPRMTIPKLHPQLPARAFECGYTDERDIRGCRRPRSATDCLSHPSCQIDKFYPSCSTLGDTNYSTSVCPNSENCSSCSPEWTDNGVYRTSLDSCVGASGCLCPLLLTAMDLRIASSSWACDNNVRNVFLLTIATPISILVGVAVVVLGWLVYRRAFATLSRRDTIAPGNLLLRHMLEELPDHFQLDLFGWRRFHNELRDKQARLLRGEDMLSPVQAPMDIHEVIIPTAPEFDEEDESTAPTKENPMALATAPVVRHRRSHVDELDDVPCDSEMHPSAPDFD